MDKIEYLKNAIKHGKHAYLRWVVTAMAVTEPDSFVLTKPYDLTRTVEGYFYLDPVINETVKIDHPADKPLYRFLESIDIDNTWMRIVESPITTKIGNVLTNSLYIDMSLNGKLPFVTGRHTVSTIEDMIAPLLEDNPPDIEQYLHLPVDEIPGYDKVRIHPFELDKFANACSYVMSFSQLAVVAATAKNILPPPGIQEFLNKTIKEKFNGEIKNKSDVALLEGYLKEYATEYIKDDPSYGIFLSGKVWNIAYKKTNLTFGIDRIFNIEDTKYVKNSLSEGWELTEDSIESLFNVSRSASYSRGHETQKGGIVAKNILRATSNLQVSREDCGSNVGITYIVNNDTIKLLQNRYMIVDNNPVLINSKEMLKPYLGKTVNIRSPIYCHSKIEYRCHICLGINLSQYDQGIPLGMTELSHDVLMTSMKAMHGTVLSTVELDIDEVFT